MENAIKIIEESEWLKEHDAEIRAEAIKECIEVFKNIPRLYYREELLNEIEQLKERK